MLVNGETIRPFEMQTQKEDSPENQYIESKVKGLSRKKYGRDPEDIEKEVEIRWNRSVEEKTQGEQIEKLLENNEDS